MGKGCVKTKNEYQVMLWMYKKRRDKLRKELYVWRGDNTLYNKKVKKINLRIQYFNYSIKVIEKRDALLKDIVDRVIEYNGIDLFKLNKTGRVSKEQSLTKRSFFKYTIELGIEGAQVARYMGYFRTTPCMARLSFQRTFKINKENKQFYRRFLQYMNRSN
jgi:hypothetical protein